jgi:hypothetical protein
VSGIGGRRGTFFTVLAAFDDSDMHRRSALHATTLVALAVLAALAGCSAFGGSNTPTPTATPEPTPTSLPTVECEDGMAPADTPLEVMLPHPEGDWERLTTSDIEVPEWDADAIEGRYRGPESGEYTATVGRFDSREEAGETLATGLFSRYTAGARVGVTGPFGVEVEGTFADRSEELLFATPCLSEDDEILPPGVDE